MEIKQKLIPKPKPTLGSLGMGQVFFIEEKPSPLNRLEMTERRFFMALDHGSLDDALDQQRRVVCMGSGELILMGKHRPVNPCEARLTVEVPFG